MSDSDASVEQIAINCGFSCSSNFIRAFRQNMGMTPLQFRKWF
ncbi:MAG TPA: helix-turn-helix domain-containing protein [Candidatus Butyricicoccus avicola]|nr:helix-turn-helix domain-containing protein [Candidatus Butyricicoccus avicola]